MQNDETKAAPVGGQEAVSAQVRFRRPEKGMPDWSVWQQTSIKPNVPAWSIDSAGYEVEYRLLYTAPQPSAGVAMPEVNLHQAITHYEAALLAAFPSGSSGEVFNQWNAARVLIARLNGKEVGRG